MALREFLPKTPSTPPGMISEEGEPELRDPDLDFGRTGGDECLECLFKFQGVTFFLGIWAIVLEGKIQPVMVLEEQSELLRGDEVEHAEQLVPLGFHHLLDHVLYISEPCRLEVRSKHLTKSPGCALEGSRAIEGHGLGQSVVLVRSLLAIATRLGMRDVGMGLVELAARGPVELVSLEKNLLSTVGQVAGIPTMAAASSRIACVKGFPGPVKFMAMPPSDTAPGCGPDPQRQDYPFFRVCSACRSRSS